MADLITIDLYKQAKAITGTKEDERLSIIVSSVSQLVKTYCGNSFTDYVSTPKVEYASLDWKQDKIILDESPVLVVSEVAERAVPTDSYTVLTASEDYEVVTASDMIQRLNTYWPVGPNAVRITYTAGYSTIPTDLNLAIIDLITYYYKEEHKVTRTLQGATVHNLSTSSMTTNMDFPDHIKRVLDLYRLQA